MKIDEILKKESVIADLIGQNKVEIIKEMPECLKKNNIIKDDQALFETLMEREKLGSTGIGENVAIPHGKSEELTQIITVFARSLKGVDFESLDQTSTLRLHGHCPCTFHRPTSKGPCTNFSTVQKSRFTRWDS